MIRVESVQIVQMSRTVIIGRAVPDFQVQFLVLVPRVLQDMRVNAV